jgi:hypothetical protein
VQAAQVVTGATLNQLTCAARLLTQAPGRLSPVSGYAWPCGYGGSDTEPVEPCMRLTCPGSAPACPRLCKRPRYMGAALHQAEPGRPVLSQAQPLLHSPSRLQAGPGGYGSGTALNLRTAPPQAHRLLFRSRLCKRPRKHGAALHQLKTTYGGAAQAQATHPFTSPFQVGASVQAVTGATLHQALPRAQVTQVGPGG